MAAYRGGGVAWRKIESLAYGKAANSWRLW